MKICNFRAFLEGIVFCICQLDLRFNPIGGESDEKIGESVGILEKSW